MTKVEFEAWEVEPEHLRDGMLAEYGRARTPEEKQQIVDELEMELNRV